MYEANYQQTNPRLDFSKSRRSVIQMNSAQTIAREETEARAFREQCRRQMARPLEARMKYGFCRVHRPVLDTPGVRVFSSTKEYREWCAANLPAYLGFQPAPAE
jgi:hypothetical protein